MESSVQVKGPFNFGTLDFEGSRSQQKRGSKLFPEKWICKKHFPADFLNDCIIIIMSHAGSEQLGHSITASLTLTPEREKAPLQWKQSIENYSIKKKSENDTLASPKSQLN